MNSRIIMASSAAFLALIGLSLTFAPDEILRHYGVSAAAPIPLLLQMGGGALVGWALVNWTARGLVVGGIYSRPLTLGNLVHFGAVTLALGKAILVIGPQPLAVGVLLGYGLFAACFGYLVFGRGAACIPASSHGSVE
jgi:hypothetical protein